MSARQKRAAVTRTVPIKDVHERTRQRAFQPEVAQAIAAMLDAMGGTPRIVCAIAPDGYRLIDGKHRLEAMRAAGSDWVEVEVIHLDETDVDASADLHEAMLNLVRAELTALDRMAHLWHARNAHAALYPDASKGGRPKKSTDDADENRDMLSQFGFATSVARHVGLDKRSVNRDVAIYDRLSVETRRRLPNTKLADNASELAALSAQSDRVQSRILDLFLAKPPHARNVEHALAMIRGTTLPSTFEKRVARYAEALKGMSDEARFSVFDACEDAVREYAAQKGWAS